MKNGNYDPRLVSRIDRTRNILAGCLAILGIIIAIVLSTSGCATIGAGDDAILIRAEDVEVNSLALYRAVIVEYHMAHSTEEPRAVYDTLETVRKNFPRAWRSLHAAIPRYKTLHNRNDLEAVLTEVEGYYSDMKRIWIPVMPKAVP